jgi:hypothetical protein
VRGVPTEAAIAQCDGAGRKKVDGNRTSSKE